MCWKTLLHYLVFHRTRFIGHCESNNLVDEVSKLTLEERRRILEELRRMLGLEGQQSIRSVEEEVIGGRVTLNNSWIGRVERVFESSEQGVISRRTAHKRVAGCSHVINQSAQVAGLCEYPGCLTFVCVDCAKICEKCRKLICRKHQRMHDGLYYCAKCYEWILVKKFFRRLPFCKMTSSGLKK